MTAKNLILIFVCLMVSLGNFLLKPAMSENDRLMRAGGGASGAKIMALKEASQKLSELPEVSVFMMDADLAGPLTVAGWLSRAANHGIQITKAVGPASSGERKNLELSAMLDRDEMTGRLRQKMAIAGNYTSLKALAEFLVEEFSAESGIVIDEMSIAGYGFELTVSIFVREKA
jgi:hypothetical protein